MYIYLSKKEGEAFESVKNKSRNGQFIDDAFEPALTGLSDFSLIDDPDLLKVFKKATVYNSFPGPSRREFGIYRYGNAEAELTCDSSGKFYYIKAHTCLADGIKDMKELCYRIKAGTITPSISFEAKQHRWFNRIISRLHSDIIASFKDFLKKNKKIWLKLNSGFRA